MEQNHAEDKANTMQRQRVYPIVQKWVYVAWTWNSLTDIAQESVGGTGLRSWGHTGPQSQPKQT